MHEQKQTAKHREWHPAFGRDDHITKQAAVFTKLKLMLVAV